MNILKTAILYDELHSLTFCLLVILVVLVFCALPPVPAAVHVRVGGRQGRGGGVQLGAGLTSTEDAGFLRDLIKTVFKHARLDQTYYCNLCVPSI